MLPDAVARPTSDVEVAALLAEATATRTPVTAAGGQSSTTGASITDRGILLSMRGCDRIVDIDPVTRIARVESGALVADVKRAAAACGLTWAPDPTSEAESTVGGALACNASGARTYWYGATRRHLHGLRVALAGGRILDLERTDIEKNTAGYALVQDRVDWFVGSEGTLGVILDAQLTLVPRPERTIALAIPFPSEGAALAGVSAARETAAVAPRCIEYFDPAAAAIARAADGDRLSITAGASLVYIEQDIAGDGSLDPVFDAWLAVAEGQGASCADVQVFDSDTALLRARAMRHAVPATMNERGARMRADGGRKVSTDWAVPYRKLGAAVAAARAIAARAGVEPAVTYGHAGNGHPHQNYIARNATELATITQVVEETLRQVLAMGGTIAAEHGIGKLKRQWLSLQLAPEQLAVMRAVKRELDPFALLAPGNVL